jgi:hypothetical protein
MPVNLDSAGNSLAPLDDGNPHDWFVPESDGFPNDWFVPQEDGYPNDWFVPALSPAPTAAQATPRDPLEASWSRLPADRLRASAFAPILPGAFGTFPARPLAPSVLADHGNLQPTDPRAQPDAYGFESRPQAWANWISGENDGFPYLVRVADKKPGQRNLDLFDESVTGTSPPRGSNLPFLIPRFGGVGPRPPPSAAQPARPLPEPPLAPSRNGAPMAPSPSEPKAPSALDWQKAGQDIKSVLGEGPEKVQAAVAAALPKYDGITTYGILVTNEGDVVPLRSGGKSPLFRDYASAGHAEGKAAIWIRDHDSSRGVVFHNNTDGTCGYCNSQIETLLPENAILFSVPPPDAIASKRGATQNPTPYVGNRAMPKLPPQYDLFGRLP